MIQAVCFDLDGTLFDDRQYVRAGLEQAGALAKERTGRNLTEEFLEAYFKRGLRERTFDHVLDEQGLSLDLVPELVEAYHANEANLAPYPGTRRVLERLEGRYDLGVLTGGTNGRQKLIRLGLDDYFDTVIATTERETTKRSPEPFKELLEVLDVDSPETVFVGDRPELDLLYPNRLGMHTIRVETGHRLVNPTDEARADHVLADLRGLPAIISDLD